MKLKPCPFCGNEAKLKHGFSSQQRAGVRQAVVQCKKCGCRTVTYRQMPYEPWKKVDEHAIFSWNRRITEEALPNQPLTLDELRGMEGEWVWIDISSSRSCWAIVKNYDEHHNMIKFSGVGNLSCDIYGEYWLAWRCRPEEAEHETQ